MNRIEIIEKRQKDLAEKIVEGLYEYMNNLKSPNNEWVVHPSEFLPANVTTDFQGITSFKNSLKMVTLKIIKKAG